jgi:type IX secretion system substrate protein/two component regulator with propeller domain
MKSCFILIIFIIPSFSFAQLDVVEHDPPPGYSLYQTRTSRHLVIDSQENIWVSFAFVGIGKYDGTNWTMYNTTNSGIPSDTITAVEVDDNGNVWVGTHHGLGYYNGVSWTVINSSNSGLAIDSIFTLKSIGSTLWIGTYYGLISFDGSSFVHYTSVNSGLVNDSITVITGGLNNLVWIGTWGGLSSFNGNNWTSYTASNSILSYNLVYDLQQDGHGKMWVQLVTYGDLFFIDNTGLLTSFCGEVYSEGLSCTPMAGGLSKNSSGNIIVLSGSNSIAVIGDKYKYYYADKISLNSSRVVVNSSDVIWMLRTYPYANYRFKLLSVKINSQDPPLSGATIYNTNSVNANDVDALILNRGDMHWNLINSKYEVPKGSGKNSVFASALWIGGLDSGGNLHLAAQTYRQTGEDYWPGPIDGISMPFDSLSCRHYNRIWKIDKYEIANFIINYLDGSVGNATYDVPEVILSWPAKGNNMVIDDKAPFVDFNNDGFYNPFDGDYPKIKGDQMLFWMFNDSLNPHSASFGLKMGIEVHASAYAYSCPEIVDSNQVLNWTTLYNFKILNRSSFDYDSLYIGLWCDVDLGNHTDDYIGCDSTLGVGFAYNGDNDDDGVYGYGVNPPMQNVVILKGMLADIGDGVDNNLNGVIDEPDETTTMNYFMSYVGQNGSPAGNPYAAHEYYNYIHAKWLNDQHLTYGINGLDPTHAPSDFLYSGMPFGTGWTEPSVGNVAEDRRFLLGSGPGSLSAGNTISIDFAYVFTWDSIYPNGLNTSIARNIADIKRVKNWFDNDNFPSCLKYPVYIEPEVTEVTVNVFPNPSFNSITIETSWRPVDAYLEIFDLTGRIVFKEIYTGQVLNIINYSVGTYIVRITDLDYTAQSKFMKN